MGAWFWVSIGVGIYLLGAGVSWSFTKAWRDKGIDGRVDSKVFSAAWPIALPVWMLVKAGSLIAVAIAGKVDAVRGFGARAKERRAAAEKAKPTKDGEYRSRPCPTCGHTEV